MIKQTEVYCRHGELAGFNVRASRTGWVVTKWSFIVGEITDWSGLLRYAENWPRGADLAARWNNWYSLGDMIALLTYEHPDRVFRPGHTV